MEVTTRCSNRNFVEIVCVFTLPLSCKSWTFSFLQARIKCFQSISVHWTILWHFSVKHLRKCFLCRHFLFREYNAGHCMERNLCGIHGVLPQTHFFAKQTNKLQNSSEIANSLICIRTNLCYLTNTNQ